MHILVTGGSGFLGRRLIPELMRLAHTGVSVHSKDCNLASPGPIHQFDDQRFDAIIHLAAWTQAGNFCQHNQADQWLTNNAINFNVLQWWRYHQSNAKLISIGTSCSYAVDSDFREVNYLNGEPIDELQSYAMTKRMLCVGQQAFRRQWSMKSLTLVPSTLYGPDFSLDGRQLHFIHDLIRKIVRGKFAGEDVVLWGDGFQKREILFVDDLVKMIIQSLDGWNFDLLNVGSGIGHTIREFAQMICDIVGYDSSLIQYDRLQYVGAKSKVLNCQLMRHAFPDFSLTPIQEGLTKTIDWYKTFEGAVQ